MKIKKNLINKYNKEDTLLVISLYPKRGEVYSAGTSGVASYAKNVISNMTRNVIVLAPFDIKPNVYEEGKVLVLRCFKINTFFMWIDIVKNLKLFFKINTVLIQFDFASYGGILTSSLIIPFLTALKIFGFKTSVVMHHVVLDITKLAGHVGLEDGFLSKIKGISYNLVFNIFYKMLAFASRNIIVLEDQLKEKLGTIISQDKITSIPHGVDTTLNCVPKAKARKLLNIKNTEYVVVFFGFVNWFKGADFFSNTFSNKTRVLGKKTRFIVAGGMSPTLKNRAYYQSYFKKVTKTITSSKAIEITGYVPQEKIGMYFSAADLVVFPYRQFITASGVLSLAFSYKKPFIASDEFAKVFDSPDFVSAMEKSNLTKKDFVFKLNNKSCYYTTEQVLKDGIKNKMVHMIDIIRKERSYKNTANSFEKTLFYAPAKNFIKPSLVLR